MASQRTIQLAEQLLGKPLASGAESSSDGTIAELILMEFTPKLDTGNWSDDKLLGAFELLAHQNESQKQSSDSFDDDAELFAKVLTQHQNNATKRLSSNKEDYARK